MSEQIYPGPTQMVKIDGSKVRSLREAKGFTQLYIATVVGVTTDTISRWENRRYPSIKEENAIKLAEALEAGLEDILEEETEETSEAPLQKEETLSVDVSHSRGPRTNRLLLWVLPLVLIMLLPFVWYQFRQPEPVSISATRILPPHIPAGQPFPVIINVKTKQPGSFSLILKETLPQGCEPIISEPPFTGMDKKTGILKWIARTSGQHTTFVYLAKKPAATPDTPTDVSMRFNGSVTLRDKKSPETIIAGAQVLPIADFHWADANRDNRIEDAEILAVYDTFSALDNVKYDWQKIDEIWSGAGYQWDSARQEFVIVP